MEIDKNKVERTGESGEDAVKIISYRLDRKSRVLRWVFIIFWFLLFTTSVSIFSAGAYFYQNKIDPIAWLQDRLARPIDRELAAEDEVAAVITEEVASSGEPATAPQNAAPPTPEAKEQIAKNPPKIKTATSISETTRENSDGSKTTVVAESAISQSELSKAASSGASPATPFEVIITDETGKYDNLVQPLKDYLNSTLKWGSEISSLKGIIIREAGETGWSGQWGGSYTQTAAGDIISAYGLIILNTSYNSDTSYLLDYLKVVLSHEYGHHYTLYHKWVDGDLPMGTRFPDSYYTSRPLSKDNTTASCDSSWDNCESEIIAEDYSYLYSGYGYHAMAKTVGLPSDPGTRNWLNNIVSYVKGEGTPVVQAPPPNSPPTMTITSPADGEKIGNVFTFAVTATDDRGIVKVDFYRDETVLLEDTAAPYEVQVDLSSLSEGTYTFKGKAYDTDGATAERAFSIKITRTTSSSQSPPAESQSDLPVSEMEQTTQNSTASTSVDTIQPSVVFISPAATPYDWDNGNLTIEVSAADNVAVAKTELYINDSLVAEESSGSLARIWRERSVPSGTYVLKAKAYDDAGNFSENSIVVVKQ